MNFPITLKKLTTFCNWNPTPEASNDCDKFEHSLTVNVDSAESDKSDDTHTTDVDSIQCNIKGCNYSHTCTYKKETDNTTVTHKGRIGKGAPPIFLVFNKHLSK